MVSVAGGPVPDPLNYISNDERELIERIVYFQDKYELPSEHDVKNVAVSTRCCRNMTSRTSP